MPLPVKCGKLLFKFMCTCRNSFTDFVRNKNLAALACFMLFDSELKVPASEEESSIHLKDRARAKLDNPFNTSKLKLLGKGQGQGRLDLGSVL